jgi:hypothetical protein
MGSQEMLSSVFHFPAGEVVPVNAAVYEHAASVPGSGI